MKSRCKIAAFMLLLCVSGGAPGSASVVNIPEKKPVVTVDVPDSWKPEETDNGIVCESPDQVATVYIEVTSAKGLPALIDENIEWLVNDQKVALDKASKEEKTLQIGDHEWSRIGWSGKSKEFGPANVGFMFLDAGDEKAVTITYWITKKGSEKVAPALDKLFASVKTTNAPAGKKQVLHAALALDKDTRPTTNFTADAPQIYAFFIGDALKAGDKVRGVWIAEDVGAAAPKETQIDEATITAETATDHSAFSLSKPTKGWPIGKYRMEIYVGAKLAQTLKFTISKG